MSHQAQNQHPGAGHWVLERVTSLALVPLTLWIIYSIATINSFTYVDLVLWMQGSVNAWLLIATLLITFYHAVLGLQVIIDDYVSTPALNRLAFSFVKVCFMFMSVASVVSIVEIVLKS